MNSFNVKFWTIETRKDRRAPYRVRWLVAERRFGESFLTKALAESYRAQLISAARRGEGFDTETGPDLRREPCAFVLNAAVRGDLVGDGAGVAGHGGRGGVDLVDEQGQGAGDAL